MANIFDNKTDKRLIKECWKQESYSGQFYTRSQSENVPPSLQESRNKGNTLEPLELPKNISDVSMGRDSSENETSSTFSRYSSASFHYLVDLPKVDEPRHLKRRETIYHSDTELGETIKLVAINNETGNATLVNKPKLKQRGFSNQASLKERRQCRRRSSLPANYLGDYLSVNNIRKRAQNIITSDTDGEVVQVSKVKNPSRRRTKLPSTNEPPANTEIAVEPEVDSNEFDNSDENEIEDEARPKIPVGFVTK